MAIHYDFYQQNGAMNDKDKLYTKVISNTTVRTEELLRDIEQGNTLTASDIKAALSALSQAITNQLLAGNNVQLDDIGTFSITMGGEITQNPDGKRWVKNAHVRNIRFHPDKRLMQQMQQAEFTSRYHNGNHSQELSQEELLNQLRKLQANHPFFTLKQVQAATHQTIGKTRQLVHQLLEQGILENISPNRTYLLKLKDS